MSGTGFSEEEIRSWLLDRIRDRIRVGRDSLDPDLPIAALGIESLQIVSLMAELEKWRRRPFVENPLIRHSSVNALARFLAEESRGDECAVNSAG
jgi:acyl carrier protein